MPQRIPRAYRAAQLRAAVCVCCDRTFVATQRNRIYCSDACRQAAYRMRKRRKALRKANRPNS